MCLFFWSILAALVSMVWLIIEYMMMPLEKRLNYDFGRIGTVCCTYVTIWLVFVTAYGAAMMYWPQFAHAMNHFFATGIRPF